MKEPSPLPHPELHLSLSLQVLELLEHACLTQTWWLQTKFQTAKP